MAIGTFPDAVDVRLGFFFKEGGIGNGLTRDTVITLHRNGANWYENSGSTTASTSDNRLRMNLETNTSSQINNTLMLVPGDGNWRKFVAFNAGGVMGDYNFKDLWNAGNGGPPLAGDSVTVYAQIPGYSDVPVSVYAITTLRYGIYSTNLYNFPMVFSSMEEHDDNSSSSSSSSSSSDSSSGPHLTDKTVYVFI